MSPRVVSPWVIGALVLAGLFGPARAQESAANKARRPRAELVQRTYSVADLVIPIDDGPRPVRVDKAVTTAENGTPATAEARHRAPVRTIEDILIATIKNTVAPQSWSEMGGRGTVDYFPLGMALVINQTPEIQEQVAQLLASLRRLQETEVSVEVRLVAVTDASFERIAREMPKQLSSDLLRDANRGEITPRPGPTCPAAGRKLAFLDDAQLRKLYQLAEADRSTNILQTPKLTLFNGQSGAVNITEQAHFCTGMRETRQADGSRLLMPQNEAFTVGLQMEVQPVVSADGRSVKMNLKMNNTGLVTTPVPMQPVVTTVTPTFDTGVTGPPVPVVQFIQQPLFSRVAIDQSFCVPAGGTVVLGGWKRARAARPDDSASVLGFIPYLGLLFSGDQEVAEPQTVLVMVTPRVIHCKNEDERTQTGYVAPPPASPARPMPNAPVALTVSDQPAKPRVAPAAEESEPPAPARRTTPKDPQLGKLLDQYYRACRAGRRGEAQTLALKALVIDPTCFGQSAAGE